jgi:tetratricopeptide (TPR) repeat protein
MQRNAASGFFIWLSSGEILDRSMIMSYINEALQKAQREKESHYASYGNIISALGEKNKRSARRYLKAGLFIVISLALIIGELFFLYGDDKIFIATAPVNPATQLKRTTTVPVTSAVLAAAPVAPVSTAIPAPVLKMPEPAALPVEITDTKTLFAQAIKKQQEGNNGEAEVLYKKVIKNDSRNVRALNNLGVIYMGRQNYAQAVGSFKKALALKPQYVDAHYNLACLYSQKKEYARSLHHLKNAVALNPEVRNWAKKDNDLKELSRFPDFRNLLEGQEN